MFSLIPKAELRKRFSYELKHLISGSNCSLCLLGRYQAVAALLAEGAGLEEEPDKLAEPSVGGE